MNVSDYRTDYAAYCSTLELAHYRNRAGFERELNIEPIYDRYGGLYTRAAIDELERSYNETPEQRETERVSLHKLTAVARMGYLETEARELTAEIARFTSSQLIEWNGERIPLNNVQKIISNEPRASSRRELAARWIEALCASGDLRAARIESFHESSRALGFESYRALFTSITGVDYRLLASKTQKFLQRTEPVYMSALARATARDLPDIPFDDLRHADYLYFQRMTHLDRFFPSQELLPTYNAAMKGFGINVARQTNIHIDDKERLFKNPRAACFRINPPDDVRLLLAPVGGSYDYTVLFHEAGHAQHFGWSSRDLVDRHPEFLYTPDNSTTEGYAFLFSHLFMDEEWLIEQRSGLNRTSAREIVRDLALVICSSVRRRAGSLNYEIALHQSSDLRSEQLSSYYSEELSQAMGFRRDPELYLTDVDDGFYSAAYLRAWAFEASLREYLRTRYGRKWWASRKCGDDLIDLWNTSSRYTVEELAQLIGFGEISFELLADNLIAAMKED